MDLAPIVTMAALGTSVGIVGAVVTEGNNVAKIGGGTLAGAGVGLAMEGHPIWGLLLAGSGVFIAVSDPRRSIGRLGSAR
jgi:hypothetical protein